MTYQPHATSRSSKSHTPSPAEQKLLVKQAMHLGKRHSKTRDQSTKRNSRSAAASSTSPSASSPTDMQMRIGERWHAIEMGWWKRWLMHSESGGLAPGKIDNSSLFDAKTRGFRADIKEGTDYIMQHNHVWKLLRDWFGVHDEKHMVAFGPVVGAIGSDGKPYVMIELWPVRFALHVEGIKAEQLGSKRFPSIFKRSRWSSSRSTLQRLVATVNAKRDIEGNTLEHRMWMRGAVDKTSKDNSCATKNEWVIVPVDYDDDETITLNELMELFNESKYELLLEVRAKGSSWPRGSKHTPADIKSRPRFKPSSSSLDNHSKSKHGSSRSHSKRRSSSAAAATTAADDDDDEIREFGDETDEDEYEEDDDDDDDGSPPSKLLQRSESESVDMRNPQAGQELDAKRKKDGRWYEARVEQVTRGSSGIVMLLVHFLSFDKKDDEEIASTSERIAPPHTKVRDWRTQLKVHEEIEVHRKALKQSRAKAVWSVGKVRKFNRNNKKGTMPGGSVTVRVKTGVMWNQFKDFVVPLRSERLAGRNTHLAPAPAKYSPSGTSGAPVAPGIVGLRNLGNTCFMNSMLQCLSHTLPLREYMLNDQFRADINRKNPLGTGGELAEAFAQLLEQLWSDDFQVVSPTDFKRVLGTHFAQFQGYQQQDSHELFSLLLDALHEDLNLIKKKPATAPVESAGRPDAVVAKESWDVFKLRNDSIVVDKCMGMLRSHLTCPECKTETIKYDPYSAWSVPVPSMDSKTINICFFQLQVDSVDDAAVAPASSKPVHRKLLSKTSSGKAALSPPKRRVMSATRYSMSVSRRGTGADIAKRLSDKTGVAEVDIVVMETFKNKQFMWYFSPDEDKDVRNIREEDDLIAYQLLPATELRAWRRASPDGPTRHLSTQDVPPPSHVEALADPVWDELEKMYHSMARSEDLVNLWWKRCCVQGDVEVAQEILVTKLRAHKLPGAAKKYGYQRKVSMEVCKTIRGKGERVVPVMRDWFAYEFLDVDGASKADVSKAEEFLLEMEADDGPDVRKLEAYDAKYGRNPTSKDDKLDIKKLSAKAHPAAAALSSSRRVNNDGPSFSSDVSSGGVIPIEVQHISRTTSDTYPMCFRAPDVIAFLPDSSWNEVHQVVWRHVKWMLKETAYLAPQSWLARFGMDDASLERKSNRTSGQGGFTGRLRAMSKSASNKHKEPKVNSREQSQASTSDEEEEGPFVLCRETSSPVAGGRSVPLGRDKSSLSLSVPFVIEWTASGVRALKNPPKAVHMNTSNVVGAPPSSPYTPVPPRAPRPPSSEFDPVKLADDMINVGVVSQDVSVRVGVKGKGGKNSLTLTHCFDKFKTREQLSEGDEWYCPKCKELVRAFKQMALWTAPEVLVIHLKRFLYERSRFRATMVHRDKISDPIDFPLEGLDIRDFVYGANSAAADAGKYTYDLYAVSNHIGGIGGGHYTAYVKHSANGNWYDMNDARTTKVEPDMVCSPQAYVLFYRRRKN